MIEIKNSHEVEKTFKNVGVKLGLGIDKNTKEYCEESLNFLYHNLFQNLKEFDKNRNKIPYDQSISIVLMDNSFENLWVRLCQNQNSKCFKGKRVEKLNSYLKEINDICEFLNKKYQLNY